MKSTKIFNLTVILLFVLTACGITTKSDDPKDVGDTAPYFSLESLDGEQVRLEELKGKVVLLFFFGDGWPSCRAVAPKIESELVAPYSNRDDYIVLGLNTWTSNATSVESFKKATNVSFPLLLFAAEVASDYSTTYDRLILIDEDSKIYYKGKKRVSDTIDILKNKIDELLME